MRSFTTPLSLPLQGRPGVPGVQTGFGSVDYSDLDAGVPLVMASSTWTPIVRNLVPSPANFNPLRVPWAGFNFWAGGKLRAKAKGDLYLFKFAYRVTPILRGSSIRFAVRPGGEAAFDFGPHPIVLAAEAGEIEVGSVTFSQQVRSRFVSDGADILMMSSSGATLLEFSPEIMPLGFAP